MKLRSDWHLRSKKWHQNTIKEALNNLVIVHKRRRQKARSVVEGSVSQETGSARRRHLADIQTERNKIVQTLVLAWSGELRAAGEQSGDISACVGERVRRSAAKPLARESLVQVEGSNVGIVCVVRVGPVWQSARDEDALGGRDREPASACVELRVYKTECE